MSRSCPTNPKAPAVAIARCEVLEVSEAFKKGRTWQSTTEWQARYALLGDVEA